MKPDNIIVGTLIASKHELGMLDNEHTIEFSMDEMFLPKVLVNAGIFKSTSEIKRLHKDRINSSKITDPLSRDLWRTLSDLEFTYFKIGKKTFWLAVGE